MAASAWTRQAAGLQDRAYRYSSTKRPDDRRDDGFTQTTLILNMIAAPM